MAKIKLVTDVSKIGLMQSLAETRRRLVISTVVAVSATYGLGFWSAHYILEVSTSVVANMFIITGNMFLVLIASFLLTVLIGDLTFPGPWRETVFLGNSQENLDQAPVSNHSGEFLVILLLAIVVNAFGLNVATGGFLERYHTVGYFRVWLRADEPDRRLQAFEKMTRDVNFQLWDNTEVQELVLDAFDDPSAEVREMAAWSAGKMDILQAREGLIKLVDDDNPHVAAEAAIALGKLGLDTTARRAIESRLSATDEVTAQVGALRGLGLMGSDRSVSTVVKLIDSDDDEVMTNAFWALRKIGSEKARPAVRKSLENADSPLKRCAAFDAMKKVASDEDVLWARREYQTGDFGKPCESRVWEERDGEKRYITIGDSYREKLLKIVANQAAREHRDWFQRIVNDRNEDDRLREVASEVIRQLRQAEQ